MCALECGAKLVLNTDSHEPQNLLDKIKIENTLKQSGLNLDYFNIMQQNSYTIVASKK